MTIAEEKAILRKEIRAKERTLSQKYKRSSSSSICKILTDQSSFASARVVLAFVGAEHEIDTGELLKAAWDQGKTLCVPRCREGHLMDICAISSFDDLERGAYGILEPKQGCPILPAEQIDFAVIPCLSFDKSGNRLGQGGGYYDRFLGAVHCPTYLVCREQLVSEFVPSEAHDYKCTYLITENGKSPK